MTLFQHSVLMLAFLFQDAALVLNCYDPLLTLLLFTQPLQHVLLRDADIDENQNVVFQFVEDILLTLFDVNFNKETIKQTVNVSA